ncbi:hypothetical protein OGH69_12585 [Flavobacterium sp. MFBS3-15]|uniref:DUF6660 family protein n=1 Tax=Flavobacterium sp. MFBS3-15 TaxID=2989816 RepID=UPI0022367B40|nr:DUF6660 family protein [Flavobacterium sp. MFBS3-15]MCW4469809.1 hypothetical protein [Flavobacterium sp. MFBS3-15]
MGKTRHILTMLFSVYLLGLMVLPCSESHAQETSFQRTVSQEHDEHDHSMEICTPFCVCGSCVAAIVLHSPIDYNLLNLDSEISRNISNFYQSVKSDFHGSIWQPPQLA